MNLDSPSPDLEILERFPRPFREGSLSHGGIPPLSIDTLQVNLGRLCNQSCRHCHVNASPSSTEQMSRSTAELVVETLKQNPSIRTLDLTGGAPEMSPHWLYLVKEARRLGVEILDRCNLTILEEEGYEWLYREFVENRITVIASFPHLIPTSLDRQRGQGVHERSLRALQKLTHLGYGQSLPLHLVYNPGGLFLSSDQGELEREFRRGLEKSGVMFTSLYCINNLPVNRFLKLLQSRGRYMDYMELLESSFNASTLPGLMCRRQISVSRDGGLFDCDFNQMLGLSIEGCSRIEDFNRERLLSRSIRTSAHCYGCTAGSGSSCGGQLTDN